MSKIQRIYKKFILIISSILIVSSCTTKLKIEDEVSGDNVDNATMIIMAYPQEVVRTTEAFYSKLLPLIGMGKQGFIRGGHACMIIIKDGSDTFEYFDFGRYISPEGYARARGANTDPETTVDVKARWKDGEIANMEELLQWLYIHPEKTRGYGDLYASVCSSVNYEKVKKYIDYIQNSGVMKYGPFVKRGTNCCRFVTDAMSYGIVDKDILKRVKKLYRLTPTVLTNLKAANSYDHYYIATQDSVYTSKRNLVSVQREIIFDWGKGYEHVVDSYVGSIYPPDGDNKSPQWQWLGGIGYGVWYDIISTEQDNVYRVSQYSVNGEEMFSELYIADSSIDLSKEYKFDYPSHYKKITLNIDGEVVTLNKY